MWWLYSLVGAAAGALPGWVNRNAEEAVVGAVAGAAGGLLVDMLAGGDNPEEKGPAMDSLTAALGSIARGPELGARPRPTMPGAEGKPRPTFVKIYCHQPPGPQPSGMERYYQQEGGNVWVQIGEMLWAVGNLDEKQSAQVAKLAEQSENRRKKGQDPVTAAMAGRLMKALRGATAILLGDIKEIRSFEPIKDFNEEKRKKAESDYDKMLRLQQRGMRMIEEQKKFKKKARASTKPSRKRSSA